MQGSFLRPRNGAIEASVGVQQPLFSKCCLLHLPRSLLVNSIYGKYQVQLPQGVGPGQMIQVQVPVYHFQDAATPEEQESVEGATPEKPPLQRRETASDGLSLIHI